MTEEKNILLIDDNEDLLSLLESSLSKAGYVISQARNGEDGIQLAAELKPDLVILDIMMPNLDGFEVCKKLKSSRDTARIPVLFLSAKNKVEDKVHGLEVGASDYLSKPFKVKELIARADALIKNYRAHSDTNPASRLPGNYSINRELMRFIETGKEFAVAYIDLDNFKAFNDKYGFYQGDLLLNITAQVLESNLQKLGDRTDFLGHVGGDDYILITSTDLIEDICFGIIHDFSQRVREAYPEDDFSRGFFAIKDRTGFVSKVPVTTISIAVVTNQKRRFTHPAQIGQIAAEIKSYLKEIPGSNFKIDQRRSSQMDHKAVHRRKILLVSKEKNGIFKARNALETSGYQVKTAENGALALVLAEKFSPDLMIIHESLDLVSGTDLYRLLKTDNRLRHIPVIYCGADIPSYMAEKDIFFRVNQHQDMYEITHILPTVEKLVSA